MTAPRRIISLVPSLTETVAAFGLRDEIVGCTNFCVEPRGLSRTATSIGGTKDPKVDAIRALRPTHLIVNEEENKAEHIEALKSIAPTYVSFPKAPQDVPELLRGMGAWLGVDSVADEFARRAEDGLGELADIVRQRSAEDAWRARRYLYLIWREPYMVAARDTYIDGMFSLIRYTNVAQCERERYPTMSVDEMRSARPDVLLLSTEPYPFRIRDAERLREEWRADAPPMLKADGQLFSWYGVRLIEAVRAMIAWMIGAPGAIAHPFDSDIVPRGL